MSEKESVAIAKSRSNAEQLKYLNKELVRTKELRSFYLGSDDNNDTRDTAPSFNHFMGGEGITSLPETVIANLIRRYNDEIFELEEQIRKIIATQKSKISNQIPVEEHQLAS